MTAAAGDRSTDRRFAPEPDADRKPDSPDEITARSWKYIARKTVREFMEDECIDTAAALTFFAVLAIAPALLAVMSILGLVSDPQTAIDRLLAVVEQVGPDSAVATVEPVLTQLSQAPSAGLALVLGLAASVWSASGYVAAFGRGMNRIYEIDEGRPIWKLRPAMLLVTVLLLVIAMVVVVAGVLSRGVARSVGEVFGLSAVSVTVWNVARWPLVVVLVIVAIAVLYNLTPNVRQPKFRWISLGAVAAVIVWVVASLAFAFYVSHLASYGRTYGSLAGFVVFLLWLWITNLALLVGAELDAELERGRELQGGIKAERTIQLPPRDTEASEKRQDQQEKDRQRGRALRRAHADEADDPPGG